jgi:hypothetical protein
MERSDSLPPSRHASLSFAWRYHNGRRCFAPVDPERVIDRPGLGSPVPPSRKETSWRVQGVPGSQATLMHLRPALRPRRDRTRLALTACRRGPRSDKTDGSPRVLLSGLNDTASVLAVYTLQGTLLVATQDSLPAAGQALPGGIGYPQGCDERFQRCYTLSPFLSFAWRNVASGIHPCNRIGHFDRCQIPINEAFALSGAVNAWLPAPRQGRIWRVTCRAGGVPVFSAQSRDR